MANLYYLIGPSGAGKDSLLRALQEFHDVSGLRIARRYITRAPHIGDEENTELSELEFLRKQDNDEFLFAWESHGYRYAVDRVVLSWLERGDDVVVNGSREYLQSAKLIYPQLIPVWITVSESTLRARLLERGRESDREIDKRIRRSRELELMRDSNSVCIQNDSSIEFARDQFLALRAENQ